MSNFKQKKVNSIINDLLFNVSLGALTLFPLGLQAVTIIDDSNIKDYTTSGIDTEDVGWDVEINTTSATAPHINHNYQQGKYGIHVAYSDYLTVNSTDKFIINNTGSSGYSRWVGIQGDNYSRFTANSELEINNASTASTGIYLFREAYGEFNKKVTINSTNGYFTGIAIEGSDHHQF